MHLDSPTPRLPARRRRDEEPTTFRAGFLREQRDTAASPGEPLAIRIANAFLARNGTGALDRAEAVRDTASRNGNIARADLFVAVCAVIVWRDRVIRRSEAPADGNG